MHVPCAGIYVCRPAVYSDSHLEHARLVMTLNLLSRYLTHIGHKIRYVRNIVNVGYLECDADDGEGKVAKKARLEQFGLMEAAQYCINRYH